MGAVWLKIKADIAGRPLVSVLVTITVVTSAALLTLAVATLINLDGPYDRVFEQLDGAHLWLHFDRAQVRPGDIKLIEALPGIVQSTGLRYNIESRVRIRDARTWVSLRAMPSEVPEMSRLLVLDGSYLVPHQNAVLASKDLDNLLGLSLGEVLGITRADGGEAELPIIGLVYDPTWDVYRGDQPPYLYVTESTLHDLFPDRATWGWSMGVRLADPDAVDEAMELIESTSRPNIIESHTDWRDVRESAIFDAQLNSVFLGTFSFFAILATVLVVASSVSSIVLSQFRQIGILRALGFARHQVLLLYVGQYLILALAGSPVGLLLGFLLSPLPLESVAASLDTVYRPPLSLPLVALVMSVIPGCVALAALGAAFRGARANVVRSIAVGAEPPHRGSNWWARVASRLGLPLPLGLGLADVSARPLRSFLTGLNLILGVIGIVFGMALNETLDAYRGDPSLLGISYDAVVTRGTSSDGMVRHLLDRAPGVVAYYAEHLVEAETVEGSSFHVRAVKGDVGAFPLQITEGRLFRGDSHEAIAGRGLLNWLGLEVGDEITIRFEGATNRPTTWRIVGQYSEASNAGQMLMVGLGMVEKSTGRTRPSTYYLKLDPDCDVVRLRRYLAPGRNADLDLVEVTRVIPDEVGILQLALFVLSGVLVGIALINVYNTSLLAVQEKRRLIGILKSIGMTPLQVVTMVAAAAGFLGLLATAVGLPVGLFLTRGLLNVLADHYGFGRIEVALNGLHAAGLVPLVLAISVSGSLVPARQAARASIVQVVRNE